MTAVVIALLILGILQFANFAELCILAHRMEQMSKRPKYDVHVAMREATSYAASVTQEALREAMNRRPS